MTREEARNVMLDLKEQHINVEIRLALDMAIEALMIKIVRCRECKYWKSNPNTKEYGVCNKASYDDFEVIMDRDDFCSYGKNRK